MAPPASSDMAQTILRQTPLSTRGNLTHPKLRSKHSTRLVEKPVSISILPKALVKVRGRHFPVQRHLELVLVAPRLAGRASNGLIAYSFPVSMPV